MRVWEKKRLGNGYGAGSSLRPAVMMEKQEAPWKEVLLAGLWKNRMLVRMRTGESNMSKRNQKTHQEEKACYPVTVTNQSTHRGTL